MDLGNAQIGYDNQEPETWELTEEIFQASKQSLRNRADGAEWVDSQISQKDIQAIIKLCMDGKNALEIGTAFKALADKAFDECAELLAQNLDY